MTEIGARFPDRPVPERADVVVIGGGIAGVMTALTLAERGVSVVVCEKGLIGGEQSGRNWGWCRKMGRDPHELPLIIDAMRQWQGMNHRVGGETGFRETGIFYLAETEAELERRAQWLTYAAPYQLDSHLIGADELEVHMIGASRKWAGALYTPSDGRAEPFIAAPAIARGAEDKGAVILTDCAVRTIERAAGRVSGVVTEKGPIACASVVVAGGVWSRMVLRNLDITLPQLKVVASVLRTDAVDNAPLSAAAGNGFAFRRRQDGGYTVAQGSVNMVDIVPDTFRFFFDFLPALKMDWRVLRLRFGAEFLREWARKSRWGGDEVTPFEAIRVLDPKPSDAILTQAMDNLRAAFPVFRDVGIADRWAGAIDVTPDALPVISEIDTVKGLFVATGLSGHGFGIGPGVGRLMADLVTGAEPVVDPAPFRFSRFTDAVRVAPFTGAGV